MGAKSKTFPKKTSNAEGACTRLLDRLPGQEFRLGVWRTRTDAHKPHRRPTRNETLWGHIYRSGISSRWNAYSIGAKQANRAL